MGKTNEGYPAAAVESESTMGGNGVWEVDKDDLLSEQEKDMLREKDAKCEWAFSRTGLMKFVCVHKKARAVDDYKTMAAIEYRLTDCNFHSLCGKLDEGLYKDARTEIESIWQNGQE